MRFNIIEAVSAELVGANAETFTVAGFAPRQNGSMFERQIPLTGSADFLRTRLSADLPKPGLSIEVAHKLARTKNGKPFEASVVRALDGPRLPEPAWRRQFEQDGHNFSLVGFRQAIRGLAGFFVTEAEVSNTGIGITVFRVKPTVMEGKVICSPVGVASIAFELSTLEFARQKKYGELVKVFELDMPREMRDAYLADIVAALGLAAGNCSECAKGPHIHPVRSVERLLAEGSGAKSAQKPEEKIAPRKPVPMPPSRRPAPAGASAPAAPASKPAAAPASRPAARPAPAGAASKPLPGKPASEEREQIPPEVVRLRKKLAEHFGTEKKPFFPDGITGAAIKLAEMICGGLSEEKIFAELPKFPIPAYLHLGAPMPESMQEKVDDMARRDAPRPVPTDLAQFHKDMGWAFEGMLEGSKEQGAVMLAWASKETAQNYEGNYNRFIEGLKAGVKERGYRVFLDPFGLMLRKGQNSRNAQRGGKDRREDVGELGSLADAAEEIRFSSVPGKTLSSELQRVGAVEVPAEEAPVDYRQSVNLKKWARPFRDALIDAGATLMEFEALKKVKLAPSAEGFVEKLMTSSKGKISLATAELLYSLVYPAGAAAVPIPGRQCVGGEHGQRDNRPVKPKN